VPDLCRPEELGVEGWVAFQRGGIRAIPGFDSASAGELLAHGWDVDQGGPIFSIDYNDRRDAAEISGREVQRELDRIQAERQRNREGPA
jgi:hypothetical protein